MNIKPIIAIDGPAGAGKSTVAQGVADKLGYIYIDTGAMYRAVAWKVLQNDIAISDNAKITSLANNTDVGFKIIDGDQHIFIDSEDVTDAIRSREVTRMSSPVSSIKGVRKKLVDMQRKMGEKGGIVMEGRDIGTVVFPKAKVKIFLTASAMERAKRRASELSENGAEVDVEQIASEIRERDLRDSSRSNAPLKQAADADLIETDNMSIEQVIEKIINIVINKIGSK
jgi:CMP/dCMP kinase